MKFVRLSSQNLLLTEILEQDVENIVVACNDDATVYYLTTLPYPYAREDALNFIKNSSECWKVGDVLRWAVRLRATGEFVGIVELRRDQEFDSLGVWCMPKARGNGYITEAIQTVVAWSIEQNFTKSNAIYYACMPENAASASVARKTGFKFLGVKQSKEPYIRRDTGTTYKYLYSVYAPTDVDQFSSWGEYL
jgi:RimJ/RimL family protein N-acetyltransferase